MEDVTHRYGKVTVFDGVTLALSAGRAVGLIGPASHDSIRKLWGQLVYRQPPTVDEPAMATTGLALAGFTPPHLGPSENVAQHASTPVGVRI